MSCDRTAQVHAYHDGALPPIEQTAIEAHLRDCEECEQLLAELRRVSQLIASAPLAEMPPQAMRRFESAWSAAGDRGVLRIAGWLTAAAAAILLGALSFWPNGRGETSAVAWQTAALMPPVEARDEPSSDLVAVAQWMANDLSPGESQ